MTKSILFSVIAIGIAATVIGFAATQAAFTDSQQATGEVNAGTIDLYLAEIADDDNAADEFVFELPLLENLLPGQFATDSLQLRNTGTAPLTIASLDFTGSTGAECDANNAGPEFVPSIGGVAINDIIAPGASVNATVQVNFDIDADNDCQGAIYGFKLVVGVTS